MNYDASCSNMYSGEITNNDWHVQQQVNDLISYGNNEQK